MRHVKCKSGLIGWQCRLRKNYKDQVEFEYFSNMHGLHVRLGYSSPSEAWQANPLIQGSVNPSDYRRIQEWGIWIVRYWSQDPKINDCFGNSGTWIGKARTQQEAIKKAEKFVKQFSHWFRLHSAVIKIS
jgi:hypothetical protein